MKEPNITVEFLGTAPRVRVVMELTPVQAFQLSDDMDALKDRIPILYKNTGKVLDALDEKLMDVRAKLFDIITG